METKKGLVFFMEDDGEIRKKYSEFLEKNGFVVRESCNGKEGCCCLKAAQKSTVFPEVIIMDLIMPKMDAIDVLKRIKKHEGCNTIPVIVLSESESKEDKEYVLSMGADEFLLKSELTPEILMDAIKKATTSVV
ncbi:MAG: One-component system sensor protein [Candidatus Moranbacteria bacterium GW2011_GWE2_35_2-]|nr:MAG: One-component system sensor protein [Candidatus Moranbacteria bacterium GW2011_GWE2_35_2-]KKQ06714.1 MAG: One-component system sensor protein [Candidatus Moranbacteria bacterium GW2011_GWF1_36_4]KKQ22433.1 MAG: One-component system sensor protein [Candidatus Moranbacteria bacterium GW2011_GWF2_37_11]KKQ29502.1 MAG: One-component system sensor protein [Candidatus Moranbacteria bacterium GW2011_GWD1_37_17]KKQ30628.1 MAG: One-component system sensor protein [Candidatus Moranbacteria bacter